jgi:predicted DCC family thiol-disulfide oxidoreductase YuxK
MKPSGRLVLLYDGTCGLCSRLVQFVLRADPGGSLCFGSLQGAYARELWSRHPELRGVDSMAWVEPAAAGAGEWVFVRSEAALRLARYLGYPWRLLTLGRCVPRSLRDRLYDFVARRRHRWFGTSPACPLGTPDEQARFLLDPVAPTPSPSST